MALFVQGKNTVRVIAEKKQIAYIYQGALLLWAMVRSCFGSGVWVGAKPWLGNEGWRATKRF